MQKERDQSCALSDLFKPSYSLFFGHNKVTVKVKLRENISRGSRHEASITNTIHLQVSTSLIFFFSSLESLEPLFLFVENPKT